jgi:hypothetical protein
VDLADDTRLVFGSGWYISVLSMDCVMKICRK